MAESPPSPGIAERWLRGLAVCAAVAATLPGPASSLEGGVDGSWRWAINAMPTAEARFGDVVFPYGPFGFVLLPTYDGGKAAWALAIQWSLHALFAVALWRSLRHRSGGRCWILAAAICVAHWAGMLYESQLVVGLLLLLAPTAREESDARWPALACGALAGLAVLAKLSLGAAALASIAALALPPGAVRRRNAVAGLVAAAAIFLLAAALSFRSLPLAWRWLTGSVQVARGFAEAMTTSAVGGVWWAALAGLALFAALAVWLNARRSPAGALAWLCAPGVLLAFAHAATRLDAEHARLFAPFLLVVLGLLTSSAAQLEAAVVGGATLACALAIAPWIGFDPPRGRLAAIGRDFSRRAAAAVAPRQAAESAVRRSREALAPLRLSSPWLADWRRAGRTVDALPLRLGYLAANDLRWRPNPTLQLIATLTGSLDRRGAEHFCGAGAPDRLLVRFEDIDGRNMVWDAPLTWRAIAACFEPDAEAGFGDEARGERRVRALRRRQAAAPWQEEELGEVAARRAEWIEVPDGEGIVIADWTIERAVLGRLTAALRPAAPLWLEVELASGRRERWRLVRATAPGGLQLAPLPAELRHLNAWWSGNRFAERRVRRARWLVERDAWAYKDRATIRFRRAWLPAVTPPAAPRSAAGATR